MEGGDRRSDGLQGIETKWEPEAARCHSHSGFIPQRSATQTAAARRTKSGGRDEKVWAACHRSNAARRLAKETRLKRRVGDGGRAERAERAGGAAGPEERNGNISWLLFRSTFCTLKGAPRACPYICPPHVGVRWVGCTFFSLFFFSRSAPYIFFLLGAEVVRQHRKPKRKRRISDSEALITLLSDDISQTCLF